ncbi:MAG: biotin/lipoyl-binding protein [Anaerolineaceae bacterium]|nr:biotin/lipoyl-binding protein [Anaerolineaceae bacterium]
MSVVEVKLPKWGLTMEEGTVSEWLVSVGETVEAGQVLANVETEKVTTALESPVAGVVQRIEVLEGEDVVVGTVLCRIAES